MKDTTERAPTEQGTLQTLKGKLSSFFFTDGQIDT